VVGGAMGSRAGGGVADTPPGLAVQGEEVEQPLLGGEGAEPPTSQGRGEYTSGNGERITNKLKKFKKLGGYQEI